MPSPSPSAAAAVFALTVSVLLAGALIHTRTELASAREELVRARMDPRTAYSAQRLLTQPSLGKSRGEESCASARATVKTLSKTVKQCHLDEQAMKLWGVPRRPDRRGIYPACDRMPRDKNRTTQWVKIASKSMIPQRACARYGKDMVQRPSVCGLNNVPPLLPNTLTETVAGVRLVGDRFRGLQLNVKPGGNLQGPETRSTERYP